MPNQHENLDAFTTEHLQADLKGHSVRGGLATFTSQGTTFLIQTVSTVVLARLLVPADFGLVAMVSTITGLGSAFADHGISEATIQRKEITHNQVSVLFWINVAIGLGLMSHYSSLGSCVGLVLQGTTTRKHHARGISNVPNRRFEGTARCHSQAPDALFIHGDSGHIFVFARCRDCHHNRIARRRLLGNRRPSLDSEF